MAVDPPADPARTSSDRGAPADAAWYPAADERSARRYDGVFYSSRYLTMRDGVKIAIDLYLPRGLEPGATIPAIVHQTRYCRSVRPRRIPRLFLGEAFDHRGVYARMRARFVPRGYAWIDVDVRGSGASFGKHIASWSPDEIRDGAEIVDWIVGQPWSNGKVGSLGTSYDGTAAEMLLLNGHPAVKAVAPQFALFDVFTDVAFPGGIRLDWFLGRWAQVNDALDRSALHEVGGLLAWLAVDGVQPVQGDEDGAQRGAALREHADNFDVDAVTRDIVYRDDVVAADPFRQPGVVPAATPADPSGTIGYISPHNYLAALEASHAAVYSYSGWFDAAYANAAIKRHLTLHNPANRLLLGPWNHGGRLNVSPAGPGPTAFDHDGELLRFFDHHLLGLDTGIQEDKPVRYYTMGEERWKGADTWPVPGTSITTFYLADADQLALAQPQGAGGRDRYEVDYSAGSGTHSRWRSLIDYKSPVKYPDRAEQDRKLKVYTSAPLEEAMEVTGHPLVRLFVSSSASDGGFFVYLEDLDERGRIVHVTEGLLRAAQRKLSVDPPPYRSVSPYRTHKRADAAPLVPGEVVELVIDLLPTSYLFARGHRIRVAIAGADRDHFAIFPELPPTVEIHRTPALPSALALPVVPRAAAAP